VGASAFALLVLTTMVGLFSKLVLLMKKLFESYRGECAVSSGPSCHGKIILEKTMEIIRSLRVKKEKTISPFLRV
jgi:hypothetical protein